MKPTNNRTKAQQHWASTGGVLSALTPPRNNTLTPKPTPEYLKEHEAKLAAICKGLPWE